MNRNFFLYHSEFFYGKLFRVAFLSIMYTKRSIGNGCGHVGEVSALKFLIFLNHICNITRKVLYILSNR